MYVPSHFAETRVPVLHQLIATHPLATVVTFSSEGLSANHIPLELNAAAGGLGILQGHVARANPMWRDFSKQTGALAVFQGPERYISPNWYPSKPESGKVVPTWNYAVVHASGPLEVIEDRDWLLALVSRLTDRHEMASASPWKVADAPADYIENLLRAIVGIRIPISKLTGKWKVSQNRSAGDREGVAGALQQQSNSEAMEMAHLIRQSGE